jgi:hypothetical protein
MIQCATFAVVTTTMNFAFGAKHARTAKKPAAGNALLFLVAPTSALCVATNPPVRIAFGSSIHRPRLCTSATIAGRKKLLLAMSLNPPDPKPPESGNVVVEVSFAPL